MKLLFVQSGSHIIFDDEGNAYVTSNDDQTMWKRYRKYCDELRILLRRNSVVLTKSQAAAKFFPFYQDIASIAVIPDINSPRRNFFNLRLRKSVREIISEEVRNADKVIVRCCGFWPSTTVIDMCRKYNKPYMIEAFEFPFALRWYSGNLIRKIMAPYAEIKCRREIARAPYVSYVSQRALQERYPTNGKSLGCSDVELQELDPSVLEKRKDKASGDRIIFGSAGGVYPAKGQEHVLRAMSELRKQGITNIEYHLAGGVSWRKFETLINSLGLQEQVKLYGAIPHGEIFNWYDHLDVYIQPSLTEALGRSVVEAMSKGLPAACSRVGGMVEYASEYLMFEAGNTAQICEVMKKLLAPKVREREAAYSFAKAKEFAKSRLDPIRDKFYMEFMKGI